jgi:hypothetical protein
MAQLDAAVAEVHAAFTTAVFRRPDTACGSASRFGTGEASR